MMEQVFGFDIGTGSLGIAVRRDFEMIRKESLLLPAEAGTFEELRAARRQYRTRLAHAAREAYWRQICLDAGIEVLRSRQPGVPALHIPSTPGDPRLEREFAASGDETVYTSCLLRIKLLRGEKLEGWQVYKAVRSALQRRGFDRGVPWKNRASSAKGAEEDSATAALAMDYEKMLSEYIQGKPEYLYPCYFDAFRMGLWNPETDTFSLHPAEPSQRARGFTPPRELVIAELRQLLTNAAKLFPKLAGKTEEVLFGPGRKQYASYFAEKRKMFQLKEGGAGDWNCLLGQKIPRFDNRQVGHCALIPRLHVCQADDPAVVETVFLLKLKNLRFITSRGKEESLSAETIREFLKLKRVEAKMAAQEKEKKLRDAKETNKAKINAEIRAAKASVYKLTKTELKKFVRTCAWETLPDNDEVEPPKISGRSRFSRPGAKIMRDVILSGESPRKIFDKLLKNPPADLQGGELADDLHFLQLMPDSWEGVCVPDTGLDKLRNSALDTDALVAALIAEQRSQLIRLRLKLFDEQLKKLLDDPAVGKPDRIVIEFVREEFAGKEEKKRIADAMKERNKTNKEIRALAESVGCTGNADLLKLKLLKEQGNVCPYTGETLSPSELDTLEVDHIVPRHGGKNGSDGFNNKVVTKRATNEEKGARIPYEYLHGSGKWTAYSERVKKMKLSPRKKRLLLSPDAEKLDEKYSDLCSTAWLARIFRDIAMVRCHWNDGAAGEERHVIVINGKVTASLRKRYRIDSLLAPDCFDADSIDKKNRADKRHHALDAMVLTFASFWMRDPALRERLTLPQGIDRHYFGKHIAEVNPRNILLPKAAMEQTFYGQRVIDGKTVMTKRETLLSLGIKSNKFDHKTLLKSLASVCDDQIREYLTEQSGAMESFDTVAWNHWCESARNPKTGMPLKKIRIVKGNPEEYKNFSKDGEIFRGQYRRGAQHQGQFIYLDAKGKARVYPVFAHASIYLTRQKLTEQGFVIVGFFQSGCSVELREHAVSGKNHATPGIYMLKSIWAEGLIKIYKNGNDILLSLSTIPDIVNNLRRC